MCASVELTVTLVVLAVVLTTVLDVDGAILLLCLRPSLRRSLWLFLGLFLLLRGPCYLDVCAAQPPHGGAVAVEEELQQMDLAMM